MKKSPSCWAVIPAAGVGRRMEAKIPKQYLKLQDTYILDHAIDAFINHPNISGVFVALSPSDGWWETSQSSKLSSVVRVKGGSERADSVLNCLEQMLKTLDPDDWVLVHDAARPCLALDDLNLLLKTILSHSVGGLLGVPVHDTVKQVDAQQGVARTVPRENLWRAFTPQMFRLGLLHQALNDAFDADLTVTDDASAIELAGFSPLMVEGLASILKLPARKIWLWLSFIYLDREIGLIFVKKRVPYISRC